MQDWKGSSQEAVLWGSAQSEHIKGLPQALESCTCRILHGWKSPLQRRVEQ